MPKRYFELPKFKIFKILSKFRYNSREIFLFSTEFQLSYMSIIISLGKQVRCLVK